MILPKKVSALAAGLVAVASAASLAQQPPAGPYAPPPAQGGGTIKAATGETLVVGDATIDWIEKSDVSALREGVIKDIELKPGMPVKAGGEIGHLHDELAALAVKKAELAAKARAPEEKARASKEFALSKLARSYRLRQTNPKFVPEEEIQQQEAELKIAEAQILEAQELKLVAEAELELARRTLEEHTIKAPFDGVVIERMKNPGESVRANEAVVRLGNLSTLRVHAWVPLEYAFRIKEGDVVEIAPVIPGAALPIGQKSFPGKITFVDPEIEPVEHKVRVFAEVNNLDPATKQPLGLRPAMKADMTIFLSPAPAAVAAPAPAAGAPAPAVAGRR